MRTLLASSVLALLVALCLPAVAVAMPIVVLVQQSGTQLTIDAEPSDSIDNIKAKIQDAAGHEPSRQRLFFGGVELADNRTLADYNIQRDATIVLVLTDARCDGPATVGTDRRDVLRGTAAGDVLHGLGQGDILKGGGGDDCLQGGDGGDLLVGGAGSDVLDGGPGNDVLVGKNDGGAVDTVTCGDGVDLAVLSAADVLADGHGCERVVRVRR